jgi:Uma2 family endonuclease
MKLVETPELIERPLSAGELALRYEKLCEDPCFANILGKVEIDAWGRVMMTPPPAYYHGVVQARLIQALGALGGGQIAAETPIATPAGLFAADVTWASEAFVQAHAREAALPRAPELCIEIVSPSNSRKELDEKIAAYLAAGAREVWIVYPQSKRCEFHGRQGKLAESEFRVELGELFR